MVAGTDIAANCKKDPVRARQRLRGVLRDVRIVLDPQPDGTYMARFHLLPLAFAQNENGAPKWLQGGVVYSGCCGARWTSSLLPRKPCTRAESTPRRLFFPRLQPFFTWFRVMRRSPEPATVRGASDPPSPSTAQTHGCLRVASADVSAW